MTTQPIMGRKISLKENIRCDFDNGVIQRGKSALQVTGDKNVKCQGTYHSRMCWEKALEDYNQKLEETGIEEENE